MKRTLQAATRSFPFGAALALAAASFAPSAGAEVRRLPVREIDVLLALIEAEVPPSAWPAVDEVVQRYRAAIAERERAWAERPSLDRPLERPDEMATRQREQERRAEQVLVDQRRLADDLRTALLATQRQAPFDPALAESFVQWLHGRAAARTLEGLRDAMMPATPVPHVATLPIDPAVRRALASAIRPHLATYVRAADGFIDAHLDMPPGRLPTDAEHRVPAEFSAGMQANRDARQAAAAPLLAAATAMRRAALAAATDPARPVIETSMHSQLELNYNHAAEAAAARRLAPMLPGLGDGQRANLRAASDRVDAFLAKERREAIERADAADARGYGEYRPMEEQFFHRFGRVQAEWNETAKSILGDRHRELLRAIWSADDAASTARTLFGADVADQVIDDPDPSWQLRVHEVRPEMAIRWRSLADAGPVSEALSAALPALAVGDADTASAIAAATAAHTDRWSATVAPLQRRCAEHFEVAPRTSAETFDTAAVVRDLQTLRSAIEGCEDELASAITRLARDALAADRWLLERATELLAPRTGRESLLWAPLLPVPQTVDEVVARADVGDAAEEVALALAFGLAAASDPARGDQLVPALRERQAQLERLRFVTARRSTLMRELMQSPIVDEDRDASFNREIETLLSAFKADPGRADLAVVEAWEVVLADWAAALPEEAPALRRAWLVGLVPELGLEAVPTANIVDRMARRLPQEDRRRVVLESIAAGHRIERDDRVAAAASVLATMPRTTRWLLIDLTQGAPAPRQAIGDDFRAVDRDRAARTLRRAIAAMGVDEALANPAIRAAMARLESERS